MKVELKSFFTEHWKYMAVNAACKLNLFDFIASKPVNSRQIAHEMELNLIALQSLLNALALWLTVAASLKDISKTNFDIDQRTG